MTIDDISDITRKENFIYYRREFFGNASYNFLNRVHKGRIEFTIETTPMGTKDITIKIVDPVEYPLIPVIKSLKDYIKTMDKEGKLP